MTKLCEHFDNKEFTCKCGYDANQVESVLVEVLESVHAHFGKPVIIVSGRRCENHNKNISPPKSRHLLGTATNIKVKNEMPKAVADYLEPLFPNSYGIGRYKILTPIDVRGDKAR